MITKYPLRDSVFNPIQQLILTRLKAKGLSLLVPLLHFLPFRLAFPIIHSDESRRLIESAEKEDEGGVSSICSERSPAGTPSHGIECFPEVLEQGYCTGFLRCCFTLLSLLFFFFALQRREIGHTFDISSQCSQLFCRIGYGTSEGELNVR